METMVEKKRVHFATGSRKKKNGEAAVILIHGAGMDRTAWQLQTRNIAYMGREAIAVDLPGHGRSDGPPLLSIEEMADWIIRFMDVIKLKKAKLIGHSMGAFIAIETAAKFPKRVEKICLMGVASTMPVHSDLLMAAKKNKTLGRELIVYWGLGEEAQIGGHPLPGLWVQGASQALLSFSAPGVLYKDLFACNQYQGAVDAASRVECPSLIILGQRDRMTPSKNAEELAKAIPQSETSILEQCGHMMMSERPNQVHKLLKEFV